MAKTLAQIDLDELKRNIENNVGGSTFRYCPALTELFDAVRVAQANGGTDEVPTINVDRTKLIGLLEAKVAEIEAVYGAAKVALDLEDARRGNFNTAVQAHFAAIAAGLASGDFKSDEYGTPFAVEGHELPTLPAKPRSESSVQRARVRLAKELADATQAFKAQIQLLSIGSDKAIEVNGVKTSALLNTPTPTSVTF